MSTSQHTAPSTEHSTPQIVDEVYYIRGHNDVVLDVIYGRAKAIKEFILDYRDRAPYYSLIAVIRGIQYAVNPSGSSSDYVRAG
jgi:hypothetical protein